MSPPPSRRHRHPRLRLAARAAFVLFLALVAFLLVRHARHVDWSAVMAAIVAYDARTLAMED